MFEDSENDMDCFEDLCIGDDRYDQLDDVEEFHDIQDDVERDLKTNSHVIVRSFADKL